MTENALGTLYLVATPIGNLEDISFRALRILKEVSLIAAEDTRVTRKLLSHFDIHTPLTSFHRHTRDAKLEEMAERLASGLDIAVVSDAGTPIISDPGREFVQHAISMGVDVIPIPGPSAPICAVIASGLSDGRFLFEGFPPRPKADRKKLFEQLKSEERCLVFFEAPNRVESTLKDIYQILGNRPASLSREMTKKFEETTRGTVSELLIWLETHKPRGEFTIVIGGNPNTESAEPVSETDIHAILTGELKSGISSKDAVIKVAVRLNLPKKLVYKTMLELQKPQ